VGRGRPAQWLSPDRERCHKNRAAGTVCLS
jgi:hypothetical protein